MIERLIKNTLQGGFDLITSDLSRLDLILDSSYFSANELLAIKTHWTETYLPQFRYGYSREEVALPMIRVALGNEAESGKYLNSNSGQIPAGELMGGSERKGALWDSTYDITLIANNGDVCLVIYTVCRFLLMVHHSTFIKAGLLNVTLSGTELDVDPAYAPADLFFRRFAFRCLQERNVIDAESAAGKAWSVAGITWNEEVSGDVRPGVEVVTSGGMS